jgi:hypothetical protein
MKEDIKSGASAKTSANEVNAYIRSVKLHDRDRDDCPVREFQKFIANVVMQVSIADPRFRIEWGDALLNEIKETLGGCDLEGQNLSDREKMTILSDPHLVSVLVKVAQHELMSAFDAGMGRQPFSEAMDAFLEERLGKTLLY